MQISCASRRYVWLLIPLFLVAAPSFTPELYAAGQAAAQTPAEIECTSAAVGFFNPKPNGIVHMPQSGPIFLTVEVPKEGTPTRLEMSAIDEQDLHKGKAWVPCQSDQDCGGGLVRFEKNLSVDRHGASEIEGGARYSATIWGSTAPNEKAPLPGDYRKSKTVYVKLAVTYRIAAKSCVSQASWYINQRQAMPVTLVVPPGKQILGFDFYGLESPPTTTDWVPCDSWTQSGGFTLQRGCDTAGRPIGGLTYYLTWIKESGLTEDNQKDARGFEALCINKSDTLSRSCRVKAYYQP